MNSEVVGWLPEYRVFLGNGLNLAQLVLNPLPIATCSFQYVVNTMTAKNYDLKVNKLWTKRTENNNNDESWQTS